MGFFPHPRVRIPPCPPIAASAALLLALLFVAPGCVTRKLFLRSEPPGAEVVLDGKVVGTTPYEETFLSYGVRRLELRLPGFQREIQSLDVERPWWQYFPMSLVTDVLWPFRIEDDHHFVVALHPYEALGGREEAEAAALEAYEKLKALRASSGGFSGEGPDDAEQDEGR
jgi:hypothetical protein